MSVRIPLGTAGGKSIGIDLDILLRTRLLVQASSGGGKSWLLRRLVEQLYGKVQVIIIDPEGEFATLRERFGYVLAGKGGETPAIPRGAALLAHRLLELRASAVCDLYELPVQDRHAFVKRFLDALIDAPKQLWKPLVVVVDEAHVFAPEKGAGESEASDAMIGLATRGRKRGFCAVFATQRLGKLRKDAAAELTNVLIGQTFIDVDRKRAADALGIPGGEMRGFFDELRLLKPGTFWGLGRAISTERTLIEVGPVTTTHPEPGTTRSSKHANEPPPTPSVVRAMLPKLADLPAEADAKAKSEAELRAEVARLKRELAAAPAPKSVVPAPKARVIEVPVISEAKLLRIADESVKIGERVLWLQESIKALLTKYEASAAVSAAARIPPPPPRPPEIRRAAPTRSAPAATNGQATSSFMSRAERALLAVLAQRRPKNASRSQLSVLSGYSQTSSSFANALGALRSAGYVDGRADDNRITEAGLAALGEYDAPPTGSDLVAWWLSKLEKAERAMLDHLVAIHPEAATRESLSAATGYSLTSSSFANALGKLRTLELVTRGAAILASEELFDV